MSDTGERVGLRVAICVPTFRRQADLARLLATLPGVIAAAQREDAALQVRVIVVDNDPPGTAAGVVAAADLPIRHVVESERGVVAVRNRSLDEAADQDIAVFIDDDETPADEEWLARLLEARRRHRADVVAGPVRTVSEEPLDPWIRAGGFFARAHRVGLSTGSAIERAATNNLLLDVGFVRSSGVRFDPRFARSGGEDSLFTSQLHRHGARMVWCAEAAVLDHLPAERRTRAHAVERTQGMASAGVRVAVALAASPTRRAVVKLRALAAGAVHWVTGAGRGCLGALSGSERQRALGARARARGRGSILGAWGHAVDLYGAAGEWPRDSGSAGQGTPRE